MKIRVKNFSLSKEQIVLGQIFLIFIAPVLLIYYGFIPRESRMIVLIVVSLFVYSIILKEKWSNSELGFVKNNFKKYLIPYLVFMIVGVFTIILYARNFDMQIQDLWWTKPHFLFLFIFVSFLQEFAYRGFLIPKLKMIFTDRLGVVFINALLFTLLHIIFPIPQVMLPLAFIGGLVFSVLYIKYPDLILVSIAHSVLNFVAVLYGFFVININL